MRTTLTNKNTSQKVNTAKGNFYTARPKAVNIARPNSTVVNPVRANQVNAVKALTCWVWRPTKLNSASITFKRHNYVDARGRSKSVMAWTLRNLMEDMLPLGEDPNEEELLILKKQTIVATEAEYVAVASCCGQVLWIQNQMLDCGYNFMNTKIFIDNESTICIVKNPVFHSKTKRIEIRHHFNRDSNEKKLIQMIKIHTDQNVVDLLTKAFDVRRFQYLIASIRMLNL
ncbi:hypothetical protein Tco_0536615 [Tanacetum coccineum]